MVGVLESEEKPGKEIRNARKSSIANRQKSY